MSDATRDMMRLIPDAIEDARDGTLDEDRLEQIRQLLATSAEARRVYLKHNQFSRMLAAEELPSQASDQAVEASRVFAGPE